MPRQAADVTREPATAPTLQEELSAAGIDPTAPPLPGLEQVTQTDMEREDIHRAHDTVGIGQFFDAREDTKGPVSVTLADGTVISTAGGR